MKSKISILFIIFIFSLILWGNYTVVDAASISSCSVEGVTTQIYDGTPKKPSLNITFNSQKLIENIDYTLSYKNNTNVGTATVQITGKGKYSGAISKEYKILKVENLDNGNVYNILSSINQNRILGTANSSTNNGSDILLSSINGSNSQNFKFVKNNDGSYCIKNASSGRVFDVYAGNTSVNFTKVWLYDSNNTKAQKWYPVKNSDGTYTFYTVDGTALDVYAASTAINTKIEIYSSNSTPAQKFVLKSISSDSSSSSPTLVNVSSCKIEDIATETYDGTQKKPSIKVSYNNKTLVENTDYTLSYSNNINPGTATVKITGKGNYTGTTTKDFTIKPKQETTDNNNEFGANKEYYILASQMKSRAISTANSSFSNGTSIVLNTINGGNAQKFKFVKNSDGSYCIINSHSGRAIDVYAGKTSVNSTKVWLYDSNNTKAQKWYPIKNSDGTYSFYTVDGIALNLYYGRTDNNTKLEIYGRRSSSASQRFVLKDASTFTPASISTSSTFFILSKINSSKALDIYAGSKTDHANVDIYNLNKTPAQIFKFIKNNDSTYTIVNVNSNKAVHILGNGANDGTNVIQYSRFNSNAQKWYAFTNTDKSITFISCETGKALNLNGGNTNNFTTVNVWNWNENNAQKWILDDLSSVTLNKTSETLNLLSDTKTLTLKPSPSDGSYEWSSKNPEIASVNSSGKVTAKSVGSTVITVKNKSNGKTANCTIKVIAIKFEKIYTSLTVGSKEYLKAVTPALESSSSESLIGNSTSSSSSNNDENTNTESEENKESSETNTEDTNTESEESKDSSETNTEDTITDLTDDTPKTEPVPSVPTKYKITSGSGIASLNSETGELVFKKAGKIVVTAENETYGAVSQTIEGKTEYLLSPYSINEKSELELYSHLKGYQMQGFNISESGGVFYSIVDSYTKNETSTLFVKNNAISSQMKYYNFGHGSGFDTEYIQIDKKNIVFTESVGYGTSSNYAISILNWHNGDTYNVATGNVKVNNKTISNLTGANFVYYTPNSKSNTTFNSKNGTYWKSIKVAVDDKYVLLYHSGYMYVYYLSDFMNVFNNPNNSKLLHNYTISTESTYYNINNQTISNAEVTIKAANIADFPLVAKPFKAAQVAKNSGGTALTYSWQGISINGDYAFLIEGHRPNGASSYDTTKVNGKAFLNVYDIKKGLLMERIELTAFSDSNNTAINSFSNNNGFKYKIEVEGIKIKKSENNSIDIYIGATGLENNSDKKNYIGVFKYHISNY